MTAGALATAPMNEKLAETVAHLETNSESCTATFTQWAGIEALTGPQDRASHGSRIPPPSGSDCGRPQPNRGDHLLQTRRCFCLSQRSFSLQKWVLLIPGVSENICCMKLGGGLAHASASATKVKIRSMYVCLMPLPSRSKKAWRGSKKQWKDRRILQNGIG